MQEKILANADGDHGRVIYMSGEIQRCIINKIANYSLLGKNRGLACRELEILREVLFSFNRIPNVFNKKRNQILKYG